METQHEQAHPTEKVYITVAIWLAIVTAIEIAISYIEMADWIAIVSLVALSLIKFVAVVGYFMHLKFDARMLRRPFVAGFALALIVYLAVLLMFTLHDNAAS